ncbi:uncharacterized protein [Fopius arisanus]|uniref:Odorant receptor n=2 Tax=Fopius arisanus TaxID=64838 RepID=A0A9R1SUZ1_9HYME|nr:PREDICTED: uncharacterized protein LOC105263243 [Fopius arisanus]
MHGYWKMLNLFQIYVSKKWTDLRGKCPEEDRRSKINFNRMFIVSNILLRKAAVSDLYEVFLDTHEKTYQSAIIFLTISAISFFCLLGLINNFIHEWDRDMYKALESMPMILSAVLAWVEGVVLCVSSKKIKGLLKKIQILWTRELKDDIDDNIFVTAERSIFFTAFYAILIFVIGGLYLVVPLVRLVGTFCTTDDDVYTFDFERRLLPIRYPFRVDNILMYITCTAFEVISVFFLIIQYTSGDILFFQSTTILSLLLQVTGKKFAEVTEWDDDNKFNRPLLKKLNDIGKQHSELLKSCRMIEEVFNPVILLMIICSSANLCACVIAFESKLSTFELADAVILVIHFIAMILQPLIYCNSAENISHWTQNIYHTIYTCQWPDQKKKFKHIVFFIMMRSRHNYKFKAYGLCDVNRHLFYRLVRTAYNIFVLLRKTNT